MLTLILYAMVAILLTVALVLLISRDLERAAARQKRLDQLARMAPAFQNLGKAFAEMAVSAAKAAATFRSFADAFERKP